jgi:hypothetical protein
VVKTEQPELMVLVAASGTGLTCYPVDNTMACLGVVVSLWLMVVGAWRAAWCRTRLPPSGPFVALIAASGTGLICYPLDNMV